MFTKSRIAVFALNCVLAGMAATSSADDINFQRVNQLVGGSAQRAQVLANACGQIPDQYSAIRNQLSQESQRLKTFVETVRQNVAAIQQNPDNQQSLNWAIQYSRQASQSAERLESLARDLKRAADRADDPQFEGFGRQFREFADTIDDAMSRVRRELD